jgi:flagellar hook protein FlgE
MVKSMFAAVAGLRAHQSKMDVIGNNIANVNTYGYKSARATFSDVYYATTSGAGSSGEVYGGTNPSQVGYGSKINSIDSLMTSGGAAATDSSTDCMIEGNGFFLVGTKGTELELSEAEEGTTVGGVATDQTALSALKLTRVGIFNFDEDGYLVDSNGMCAYGFQPNGEDATEEDGEINTLALSEIRLPNALGEDSDEYEPIQLSSISIGSDGIITGVNDAEEVITIGQIALANVPNPNALERGANGYYTAKNNTGTITVNPSGQNSTGQISSGYLEMSNVDLSKEFTEMITCQRGFQANTRIITVTDTMLEELVNLKR